jgi:hypothetical protein
MPSSRPLLRETHVTTGERCAKSRRAAGFTHIAWPTKIVKAKIVVLGLDAPLASR